MRRYLLDASVTRVLPVEPNPLYAIEWLVWPQTPRQVPVKQNASSSSVHAKEWRFCSARLDCNNYRAGGLPSVLEQNFTNIFDRGRLKERSQRKLLVKHLLELSEEADGEQGVPSQIKEVILDPDRLDL